MNSIELVEEFGTLPQIADHEGTLLCLSLEQKSKQPKQTIIFDYKNADLEGLTNFIKGYDFENQVFSLPVQDQADRYSQILISCFDQFVPKKTVFLKPHSIPWCNTYTRLLLRKKNRNYKFFKKVSNKYSISMNNPNIPQEISIQLLNKKIKAQTNFKTASKESSKSKSKGQK